MRYALLLLAFALLMRIFANWARWGSQTESLSFTNTRSSNAWLCFIPPAPSKTTHKLYHYEPEFCFPLAPHVPVQLNTLAFHEFHVEWSDTLGSATNETGVFAVELFSGYTNVNLPDRLHTEQQRTTRLLARLLHAINQDSIAAFLARYSDAVQLALCCAMLLSYFIRTNEKPKNSKPSNSSNAELKTHHVLLCIAVVTMLLDHYGRVFHSEFDYPWTFPAQFGSSMFFYFITGSNSATRPHHASLLVYLCLKLIGPPHAITVETLTTISLLRVVIATCKPEKWSSLTHTLACSVLLHLDCIFGGEALGFAYGTRSAMFAFAGALTRHKNKNKLVWLVTGCIHHFQLDYFSVLLPSRFTGPLSLIALLLCFVVLFVVCARYEYKRVTLLGAHSVVDRAVLGCAQNSLSIYFLDLVAFKLLQPVK
jgi:hypothetical protein